MDQIKQQLDTIEASLKSVADGIKGNIVIRAVENIPGVKAVIDWITNSLDVIERNINQTAQSVKDQIGAGIQNAIPDALSVIGGLVASLENTIATTVQNIATADDFATSVVSVIRRYDKNLAGWIYNLITGSIGNTALGVLHTLELERPDMVDPIIDELLKVPGMPEWMRPALGGARERGAPFVAFLLPALILAALLPALGAMSEPFRTAVLQGAYDHMPTKEAPENILTPAVLREQITEERWLHGMRQQGYNDDVALMFLRVAQQRLLPEQAVRLLFRGHWTQAQYEGELRDRGLDPERAIDFYNASYEPLPEQYVQTAWLRGLVSDAEHDRRLGMLGVPLENAALLRKLYFRIPDPADLIHMAIRNVFSPEIVERFQLFGDFPEAFKTAAEQQGISEYWAKNYWGAHWIVPSNSEGYEMFQRTTLDSTDPHHDTFTLSDGTEVQNVIGLSTLRLLLREKDVAPYYRDKLIDVAYSPLTRIDVRRMHKVGVLSHAGVQRAYLDLGYSPANALRLADYVQKLNTIEAKDRSLPLTDSLRRQVINLYVQDKLDLNDASFAFTDLGFTDDETNYYLAAAKLVQTVDDAQAIESGIGKLYVAGFIKVEEVIQRLRDAMVPDAGIARLISKWNLTIQYDMEKRLSHPTRDLSKTELLDAFKAGMILEPDVIVLLDQLGYSDEESQVLVNLAKFQRDKSARTSQIDALKALYINGVRPPLDVSNALDQLGVLAMQRDAYLAEWELLREQRTEKLPLATLRDMFKRQIINLDEATAQLRRHRLTDDDIAKLIQLWGAA